MSYVYEKVPTNKSLTLARLSQTLVLLSRNLIRKGVTMQRHQYPVDLACSHQIRHTHTWTLTPNGSMVKFTQSNSKSLFTGEIIGSNFIKSQNILMTLCRQKVTEQGKMSRFRQGSFKTVLLQYLCTMRILTAQTGTTRLQLQFQQSFSQYVL